MPTAVDADELRAVQSSISDMVEDALSEFVGAFDLSRPEAMAAEMLVVVPALVAQYGDIAATAAADWYDEQRSLNGVPGRFRAPLAPGVPTPYVEGTVRRIAGYLFTESAALLLPALIDKSLEYALRPGRDTITGASVADPQASGWKRVTRPGSCDFCQLLAGRGAVFKKGTADFASHGHCHCAAVPSWDPKAPEVDVRLYEMSRRTSSMSEGQRQKHRDRLRAYMAAERDHLSM